MITPELLKEFFYYNKDTGIFTRIKRSGSSKKGDIANKINCIGYVYISFLNKKHLAHRLAWLYEYGYYPDYEIDHIDGNPLNNKIINLRKANSGENKQNIKRSSKNNKLGVLGVCFIKSRNKFLAQIMINYKQKFIGYFNTQEEAYNAYVEEKRKLHPFGEL
ncbi:MAG: HNH endonuclease signature motif containing protein [Pedobacter sp.]|jgi:hypothetical protein|uniref:HNH endonuclease signature motif containing protein n=1 Tax=Pedobacter sp. TaxID=1411316 RepID=UPI003569F216